MTNGRVPKILIISSDTGGGHRSAAAAIVAGLQKFFEGESYAVRVVRAIEDSHSITEKLVRLQLAAAKSAELDEVFLLGSESSSSRDARVLSSPLHWFLFRAI